MAKEPVRPIWTTQDYYIDLPYDEAIALKEQIVERIWEIAREEKDDETGKSGEEILRDAEFDVEVAKPALVETALILMIVGWAAQGAVTGAGGVIGKSLADKAGEMWQQKIWPKIKEEWQSALKETDNE